MLMMPMQIKARQLEKHKLTLRENLWRRRIIYQQFVSATVRNLEWYSSHQLVIYSNSTIIKLMRQDLLIQTKLSSHLKNIPTELIAS